MSFRVSVPLRFPVVVGLKTTLIEHEPPARTLDPQVLLSVKSPVTLIPAMLSAMIPLLVSLTV